MPVINQFHTELWFIHGSSLLNLLFYPPKQHQQTPVIPILQASIVNTIVCKSHGSTMVISRSYRDKTDLNVVNG